MKRETHDLNELTNLFCGGNKDGNRDVDASVTHACYGVDMNNMQPGAE